MQAAIFALIGVTITGLLGLTSEIFRRHHERKLREEERNELRADERRRRLDTVYSGALERLVAAHEALHRAVRIIASTQHGYDEYQPFPFKESMQWAIDEAEALRSARPDIELYGEERIAAHYSAASQIAGTLREAIGAVHEDVMVSWLEDKLDEFDQHYALVRSAMRSELANSTP